MKLTQWGYLTLLLLLLFCISLPDLFGQEDESTPPQKMRLCIGPKACANLTWVGDHYDARADNETEVSSRYWITLWEPDHVEISGKTAKAADGVYPAEGTFSGKISPRGDSLTDTVAEWRVGPGKSGTMSFTLTWVKSPSNAIARRDVGQFRAPRFSKSNSNIELPPGATEDFASYPDEIRAFLQPEYPLTPTDARRDPHDMAVQDKNTALEIAKFAYRAGDFKRGNWWTDEAVLLGSTRAKVLRALQYHMGWDGSKDDAHYFKDLDLLDDGKGNPDLWGLYFLEKCYMEGIGTSVDRSKGSRIDAYLMVRPEGRDLFMAIGADDAEVRKERMRNEILLNPPMTTRTQCYQTGPPSTVLGGPRNQRCESISIIDEAALQRKLKQVEQQQ